MFKIVDESDTRRFKELKDTNLSIKVLELLNLSAFKAPDFNLSESIKIDVKDIMTIIHNTPIQLRKEPKFRKIYKLLIHELGEEPEVIDYELIKIYYEKFVDLVLDRVEEYTNAIGLLEMLLGSEIKLSSTMLTKIARTFDNIIKESVDEESEDIDFETSQNNDK